MGQCYTVEARLRFKNNDPSRFCEIVQNEVAALDGKAIFDLSRGDLNDPFGCFKILTSEKAGVDIDGYWYADFSGSYGWEWVMNRVFRSAAEALADGSFIKIYPDEGVDTIWVRDGKVAISQE